MKLINRWGAQAIVKFEELLEQAEDNATKDWDIQFCKDMRKSFNEYQEHTWMTNAQLSQLNRISGEDNDPDIEDEAPWGR